MLLYSQRLDRHDFRTFSIEYLRENEKVRETVHMGHVESLKQKNNVTLNNANCDRNKPRNFKNFFFVFRRFFLVVHLMYSTVHISSDVKIL